MCIYIYTYVNNAHVLSLLPSTYSFTFGGLVWRRWLIGYSLRLLSSGCEIWTTQQNTAKLAYCCKQKSMIFTHYSTGSEWAFIYNLELWTASYRSTKLKM